MPRNSSGNYSLPAGNPVQPDTIIETAWANPTMADIASALSDSLDRYGRGGMLAEFKVTDGTAPAPGLSFLSQSNLGMYRDGTSVLGFSVAGGAVVKLRDTSIDLLRPVNFAQGIGSEIPGAVRVSAGTLAAPSLVFADTDTGFFSPADGVLALVLNGVEVMRWTAAGVTNTVPIGTMLDFAGAAAPTGYLLCDGSAYLRTSYPDLFAAIGTTWGAPDAFNFNVPDMRRRVALGAGGTAVAGPAATVGAVGGAENIALVTGNLPSHTHGITDPGHAHAVSDPGHAHALNGQAIQGPTPQAPSALTDGAARPLGNATFAATTGIGIAAANTGINITQATGSGTAFGLHQPSATVTKIIKF